jgi:ribosomal-protein-serine acetyltransferase
VSDTRAVWQAIDESRASLERWVPDIGSRQTPDEVAVGLHALLTDPGERLIHAICDRATGRILGEVGLYTVDWQTRTGEIGYWLRETARHQGFMAEALRLFVDHATHGLGLGRLEAHVASGNTDSVRAVERLGFRPAAQRAAVPGLDAAAEMIAIFALERQLTV